MQAEPSRHAGQRIVTPTSSGPVGRAGPSVCGQGSLYRVDGGLEVYFPPPKYHGLKIFKIQMSRNHPVNVKEGKIFGWYTSVPKGL